MAPKHTPTSAKRLIIIPAFNEEKQITSVIEGIRKYSNSDIVLIDDGSKDQTAELAKSAGAFIIRHPFNMGCGVALQTGFKYASEKKYDYLLQIDGDGQHHPKHIMEMFTMVENHVCDLAIGSRFLKNNKYKMGILKSVAVRLFRLIIRILTGETLTDPTSGYRCMNQTVFQYCMNDEFPHDYPDANIIIMLHRMGFKLTEHPVTMVPNPEGRYMHRGALRIIYYMFKVFLSILVTLLRKKAKS